MAAASDPRPAVRSWVDWWDAPEGVDAAGWRADAEAFARAAGPVLGLRPDDDLLDVGCGPGFALAVLAPQVRSATGIDPSPRAVAAARERFGSTPAMTVVALDPARPGDLTVLGARRFSAVVCNSVLQYLPDLDAVDALVRAIRGVCAPGARVLLSDLVVGGGRVADVLGLLRGARRQGRLVEAVRRVVRLRGSGYARARARLGLLAIDRDRLAATVRALGGTLDDVDAPLTILAHRRHVLARFA